MATLTAIAVAGFGVDAWYAAAVVLLLAVGVADDAVGLPPNLRLAAQGISGLLLALGGLTIEPLGVLGPVAVVLGVPVLANAVNLTDGQDGLAAGLSLVATFGLWAVIDAPGADAVVSLAFMGALLGFLIWNRPPASVFLGDGGAYVIGGVLVVIATRSSGTWSSLLGSALCVSIFALELVSTVIRRVTGSTSLVHGDRAHIYDQLARHLGVGHAPRSRCGSQAPPPPCSGSSSRGCPWGRGRSSSSPRLRWRRPRSWSSVGTPGRCYVVRGSRTTPGVPWHSRASVRGSIGKTSSREGASPSAWPMEGTMHEG